MAVSVYFNRVKYTAVSAGTVDFVTSAAVSGFLTPATASIPNASVVSYVAFSSTQAEWETGQGTYTSGTTTLARTTVRESSNAGAKVNFTAAPTVALDFQAQDVTNLPPIAVNGATIGTNALAVTGTVSISGALTLGTSGILIGGTNTVDQRNGANAQTFQVYNTYTDASNYEKIAFRYNANIAQVIQLSAGTGSARALGLYGGAGLILSGDINDGTQWKVLTAGHLVSDLSVRQMYIGWGASLTADTTLSRNAAGIIQFGTTAANAAGSWLAAKGTLTGGTLADQAQVLAITATQPASPTGAQYAIQATVTSAGSASQINAAVQVSYNAGYTGGNYTLGAYVTNSVAGTGTGATQANAANYAILAGSSSNTVGHNIGVTGTASAGLVNVGASGVAITNKNSGTNIGVLGNGLNGGTSPIQVGGHFTLGNTVVPTVSAALIADNGAQTDAIFLARDNGSTVFTIADGGGVTTTGNITKLGGAVLLTTSTALTDGVGASAGTITNAPSVGNPTKWIGINDNGTTRYIPAW
jgi:hypothetical protein